MTNEELVTMIQSGQDRECCLNELCANNRDFVYYIAKKYQGIAETEDLVQEGFIGLITAVEKWDPAENTSFISYAGYWIEHTMRNYINNCSGSVRVPIYQKEVIMKYSQLVNKFELLHGRKPTDREAAAVMHKTVEQIRQIKKDIHNTNTKSLDETISEDADGFTLGDFIQAPLDGIETVLDEIEQEELKAALWGVVSELDPVESEIIQKRYKENKTYKQCSLELNKSAVSIRSTEMKALKELRKPSKRKKIEPFADGFYYSAGLKHTGLTSFRNTGTSSVEWAVIKMDEKCV